MKRKVNNDKKSYNLQHSADEAQIRQKMEEHVKALCKIDLKGVMSFYAPYILSFDVEGTYVGVEEKKEAWTKIFSMIEPPLKYEIDELSITAGADVAFASCYNRLLGKLKNGQQIDSRVRYTACFRKYEGGWLIAHEHVSMPIHFENNKAVPDPG